MPARRGRWFWALATAAQGAGAQGVEEAIATGVCEAGWSPIA